jgi:hypothetical protein
MGGGVHNLLPIDFPNEFCQTCQTCESLGTSASTGPVERHAYRYCEE